LGYIIGVAATAGCKWGKIKMKDRVTHLILPAMVLGIIAGAIVYEYFPAQRVDIAANVNLITMLFLRLIKMIIAPLVFATLVSGIANMGHGAKLGRLFTRTIGWFVGASFVSLLLGLVMVNVLQPGANFPGTVPDVGQSAGLQTTGFSLDKFLTHLIPTSFIDAMAQNEILQIVVFAVFFALAMRAVPERSKVMLGLIDDLGCVMLKITKYVMVFAPLAVFSALMATTAKNGLEVLWKLAQFAGSFYLTLLILWALLIAVGFSILGLRYGKLLRLIREPLIIAFSTSTSEAAFPKLLESLERFGASTRVSGFVLPLGYSFNLDGSMIYLAFATLFIAQVYKIEIPLAQQFLMLAILMITSKGIAGVPRASLVVIAATMSQFNIPEAGLLMILGVDTFLDMGRSATNVIGNALATSIVAKWEGELGEVQESALACPA
jgi:Na+/H+-dicarboxylate symporter